MKFISNCILIGRSKDCLLPRFPRVMIKVRDHLIL